METFHKFSCIGGQPRFIFNNRRIVEQNIVFRSHVEYKNILEWERIFVNSEERMQNVGYLGLLDSGIGPA